MVAPLDITGQRFGRLVAIRRVENKGRRTRWLFTCDCGVETEQLLEPIRAGYTRSCGCLRKDVTAARSLTHGHRRGRKSTPTLKAWQHAKDRCFNPNNEKFAQYGGRGISMSDEWRNDFSAFLADMGECPLGRSLDRVNVDGHYEPRNCRWATQTQQSRSRSDNVLVEFNGMTMILKDFAKARDVDYKKLHAYVKYRGMSAIDAATLIKSQA